MSQKTTEILQQLEEGIQSLFESATYQKYLQFLANFHSYSLSNTILIFSQFPTASLVAPYRGWQKRYRHVNRGEKGIMIMAPHTYKKQVADSDEEELRLGFHCATVFDVSQTSADDERGEIPSLCSRLKGDLSDSSLMETLVSISPVPVRFEAIPGETNGYYSQTACEIVVDNTNDPVQQASTLIHEQAHYWHRMMTEDFNDCPRADKEVIAQSVAYTVCTRLGIPSDDYTFGYCISWGSKDLKELKTNLNLIRKISDQIISDIESKMDTAVITG